ncbi:MAG: transporter substrate-binding domain-containing protein [Clostridia bacterium]|nr:transporter substrate-binding domain-containing protein [Clostridia bacterium]
MKKSIIALATAAVTATCALSLAACDGGNTIYVNTNAYFAPFEYFVDANTIDGVDVEIMNLVGEKLGKNVKFENTDFELIIDNVNSGKKYDCGAAGITITEERKEKVDFSNPYFTSVQYAIFPSSQNVTTSLDGETEYILWGELAGKKIGYQRDTTGDIYVNLEIKGEKGETPDDDYVGVLQGSGATGTGYDSAQLAVDAIGANQIDVTVVDKLPAEYIVKNNEGYKCYAIYYPADEDNPKDYPTEEQYAICVTKGNKELLDAINEVLDELGEDGINKLVSKHLGISD